VITLQEPT